jgi:hypothetical protein
LQKVEKLEVEVKLELDKLKERKKKMEEELVVYSDLDGLKHKSDARKKQLLVEKQNLSRYRENMKFEIDALYGQVQAIDAQLNDNETHNQVTLLCYKQLRQLNCRISIQTCGYYLKLCNLEKKLQITEQNNFTLKESISAVTAESDYDHLKSQVLQLVAEHNKWLQDELTKPAIFDQYNAQ